MIILHNPYDKYSREFVEQYAVIKGAQVLVYPNCMEQYPNVSAFPSVVVEYPAYNVPEQIIEEYSDAEDNYYPEETVPSYNVQARTHLIRLPESWDDVQSELDEIERLKKENPPIDGLDWK
jgi:hypothetical protein